jgi:hypothetical protein
VIEGSSASNDAGSEPSGFRSVVWRHNMVIFCCAIVLMMLAVVAALANDPIEDTPGYSSPDCQESGSICSNDCHNLLEDRAFGVMDCSRVFDYIDATDPTDNPMSRAIKIKCGDDENLDYAYWTDDEFVVACAPKRTR